MASRDDTLATGQTLAAVGGTAEGGPRGTRVERREVERAETIVQASERPLPSFDRKSAASAAGTGVTRQQTLSAASEARTVRGAARPRTGGDSQDQLTIEPGQVIAGRYRVVRSIGQGGMGQVFEAVHRRLGTTVGLKTIHSAFVGDIELRRSFYREARFGASMRHPHLIGVIDYGDDDDFGPFLVMELEEGRMLDAVLRERGTLPAVEATRLCMQVLEALEFMHGEQLVHGDIKPANMILGAGLTSSAKTATLKLLDFGLSRSGALAHDGKISGTPEYLAPEVVCGSRMSSLSDIYSTGVLLYELICGAPPFRGSIPDVLSAHVQSEIPRPSSMCEIPSQLESVLMRALSREPSRRPQSAAIMQAELEDALAAQLRPSPSIAERHPRMAFEETAVARAVLDSSGVIVAANRMMTHFTSGAGRRIVGQSLASTAWLAAWPTLVEDLGRAAKGEFVSREITLPVRGASIELIVLLERCGTQGTLQISALPGSSIKPYQG